MESSDVSKEHERQMRRAIELAQLGQGWVEPNPMVGCVIVGREGPSQRAEGYHQSFGGPHAEIEAIGNANFDLNDAEMYVTLEPCCNHGKTPPCTEAIIESKIRRVFVATTDPNRQVDGGGVAQLRQAGIQVEVGLLKDDAESLIVPFRKWTSQGIPWVIAKWAMTMDGKIATSGGDSQWISNEKSRQKVHQLRGRVDAIVVGAATARIDNPLLTARPEGARQAIRVVVDPNLTLSLDSQLVKTAREIPVMVVGREDTDPEQKRRLIEHGVCVESCGQDSIDLKEFLRRLGDRGATNVLVEGGGKLLGSFLEENLIDEVHAFVCPKLVGGETAATPIGGLGISKMREAIELTHLHTEVIENDVYIHGRVAANEP